MLLDMLGPIMTQANLPITYYGDTLLTTAFIFNHVPSKLVSTIPYVLWMI